MGDRRPVGNDDMVSLAGGRFAMGTAPEDLPRLAECLGIRHLELLAAEVPRHVVYLSPYAMDRYPVTNRQFAAFLHDCPTWHPERIPSRFHNGKYLHHWGAAGYAHELAENPVVYVSWYAAVAYARWAGKRLPTEAEWEYAARGGLQGAQFPWGDEPPDPGRANYGQGGIGATTPVGSYPPNGYGLYDMAGNVWEYCFDEWDAEFYAHSPATDPVAGGCRYDPDGVLGMVTRRVIRGGSYEGAPLNLRVAYRDSHPAEGAGPHVGFRCAR